MKLDYYEYNKYKQNNEKEHFEEITTSNNPNLIQNGDFSLPTISSSKSLTLLGGINSINNWTTTTANLDKVGLDIINGKQCLYLTSGGAIRQQIFGLNINKQYILTINTLPNSSNNYTFNLLFVYSG
jgi:hypothetical protein